MSRRFLLLVLVVVGASFGGISPPWRGYLVEEGGGHRVFSRAHWGVTSEDSLRVGHLRDSLGRKVVRNWIGTLQETPRSEPFFPVQWSLENTGQDNDGVSGLPGADVGALAAWQKTSGDSSVVVALIDGGVDPTHPDLRDCLAWNLVERAGKPGVDDDGNGYIDDSLGWDFVRQDPVPRDLAGHGTATASLVGAGWNGVGLAGLAPGVRVLPVRVADASSHVQLDAILDGIAFARKRGARVINLSLGGLPSADLLDSAIARAVRGGAAVVVSAGNEGVDLDLDPRYPAALRMPGMVVVGASSSSDEPSWYSNHSPQFVDLSAPGDGLVVAGLPEGDTLWTEDFEQPLSDWTTGGTGITWGLESALGTTWLSDSPGRNYPRGANRWIQTPLMSFPHRRNLVLNLSLRGRVSSNDLFAIAVSSDSTFQSSVDTLLLNGGFRQDSAKTLTFELPAGDAGAFAIRFLLRSDNFQSSGDSGVQIDDLCLRARDVAQPKVGSYARVWGTSFSAPLVSAALALLASLDSAASPESLVSMLVAGVDVLPAFAEQSRTSGRLSVAGAMGLDRLPVASPGSVARSSPVGRGNGGLVLRVEGDWWLEWRDLRGRTGGRKSGSSPAVVPLPSGGPIFWKLSTSGGNFRGVFLDP
ncbi:MAG: S8 family serine peptidase [Fibrobacteria bacterium]|nr:S8 family serine peptidase [Fibrobacteria bacterium]